MGCNGQVQILGLLPEQWCLQCSGSITLCERVGTGSIPVRHPSSKVPQQMWSLQRSEEPMKLVRFQQAPPLSCSSMVEPTTDNRITQVRFLSGQPVLWQCSIMVVRHLHTVSGVSSNLTTTTNISKRVRRCASLAQWQSPCLTSRLPVVRIHHDAPIITQRWLSGPKQRSAKP